MTLVDTATPTADGSAAAVYLGQVGTLLGEIAATELPAIHRAARLVADAMATGHLLHVFGTGHSHMLAEELFYRAGGLAQVNPILVDGLMVHVSATLSTELERLPGLGRLLLEHEPVRAGDVLLVVSNSGGNVTCVEMATAARELGPTVLAVTSVRQATSVAGRTPGPHLHELADVVLDNHGDVGDAAVTVDGLPVKVAPTSTVTGASIVNALAAQVAALLVAAGHVPDVFASANVAGGDDWNRRLVARYRGTVHAL